MPGIATAVGLQQVAEALLSASTAGTVLQTGAGALVELLEPATLLRVLIDGLAKSALFIMIAAGLTLVFGLMGVLNFAHGSLTMIGAYVGGAVMVVAVTSGTAGTVRLAWFFVAVVVAFGLLTVAGAALEVATIRPLYDRPPLYQILLTFGLTLVFDELVRIVLDLYGLQPTTSWQEAVGTAPDFLSRQHRFTGLEVGGVDLFGVLHGLRYEGMELFQILVGVLVTASIWAFLTRTRYGLYIRAGTEDSEMTEALGIDVRRAFTVVFGVGIGIAGVAGALLMWDSAWGASVPLGAEALLPAFVVVIVGGLGTFRGTVVAGIIVGMTDATMTWVFNRGIIDFAGLPELVVFLVLVIGLIVRPQGIYGVKEVGGH